MGRQFVFATLTLALAAAGLQSASRTHGLWVFSDEVSSPADRQTLADRVRASGITDVYLSVYQPVANSSGRYMYEEADIRDLIRKLKPARVWAAYGAPDWPALGCAGAAFPLQRMAEAAAYSDANRSARFQGVMLDVEPPEPMSEADFQALLALYGCVGDALLKQDLGLAIGAFWDKPVVLPGSGVDITPKKLLIYYGFPSGINGSASNSEAAGHFGSYDYAILGAGLEKVTHPDHANTVAIISDPAMAATTVFGYIDLGVTTNNYPIAEIETRVDEWKATGALGIFFDDFGYDFHTDRARQNAAVDYARSQGMLVAANAWDPHDAFSSFVGPFNPTGTPPSLGAGDFYLSESHQIILGGYQPEAAWQSKANILAALQSAIGFHIWSITTTDGSPYEADQFHYAWFSALLYGHEATGWGEHWFSAVSSLAPYRERPLAGSGDPFDAGTAFLSPIAAAGSVYSRTTTQAEIFVNADTHAFGFTAAPAGAPAYRHILDLGADQTIVMGYRDFAGPADCTLDGAICLIQDEVAYADTLKGKHDVLAGLETGNCAPGCGPEKVTFFEEGQALLNTESQTILNHFSGSPSFNGFAIHRYEDAYLSGFAGWPTNNPDLPRK